MHIRLLCSPSSPLTAIPKPSGATIWNSAPLSCISRCSLPKYRGNASRACAYRDPAIYLAQAAKFAQAYIANIYDNSETDTLNLYDVSGLAHFELYRAFRLAGNPQGLAIDESGIRTQFLRQVDDAINQASGDAWGFGDCGIATQPRMAEGYPSWPAKLSI